MRATTPQIGYRKILIGLALAMFSLAACSPFKPAVGSNALEDMPEQFSVTVRGLAPEMKWWENLADPELNALIEESFSGNLTLRQAWARLGQARAIAVQAGSDLYPQVDFLADSSVAKANGSSAFEGYAFSLFASYELDLWGRIRSEQRSARLAASASHEDVQAAAITLAAEVAQRWANIISQRMQKQLLEKQLETNLVYLDLVELRFRKAMVSALDVFQQKQIVEQTKSEIPLVEAEEQLFAHELALLLGKPPKAELDISREAIPIPGNLPATGLPSDLLANRPDVRADWLRLRSSDWLVSAARADRLPTLRLTATGGYDTNRISNLFDDWFYNLAGSLVMPVLDGSRRAAEVDRTRAVVEENLAIYRETVLTAIKEVEDALVSEAKQREHLSILEQEIETARRALDEAGERYRNGLNDYLPVLTQLRTVQNLERDLIRQRTQLLIDRISLYRALGGTWTNRLHEDA